MVKKAITSQRRVESLSLERIVEASIQLLDSNGEEGLTFRTLSERLATGPGAIYWHIANKTELLTAACDTIIARTISAPASGATPQQSIRALALGMFDAIDAHPWVGTALTRAPGELPTIRIFERIGQSVSALNVHPDKQWSVASVLLSYILGVSGQNAANAQIAMMRGIDRHSFLEAVSTNWLQLDQNDYPFVRQVAGQLRDHDDRMDFLAGIDLILNGIDVDS